MSELTKTIGSHRWTLRRQRNYNAPTTWEIDRELAVAKDLRNGHRNMASYFTEEEAIVAFANVGPKTKRQTQAEWLALYKKADMSRS